MVRRRKLILGGFGFGLAALALVIVPLARGAAPVARLKGSGESCFVLEAASGTRIVMEPIPAGLGSTPPPELRADAVTVSHEHGDHNNIARGGGKPRILRGLTADKKGWLRIEEKVKDIAVR